MSKLLIKYPTRNRPDLFKSTFSKYKDMASGKHELLFLVSMDTDDLSMANDEMEEWLKNQYNDYTTTLYCYGESTGKISAVNRDMDRVANENWDIGILASDDMIVQVQGYDDIIAQDMQKYYPDSKGLLHYSDGLAKDALCTLTILNKQLYDYFGYWYNPEYKSLWCDNELHDVTTDLNCRTYIDNVIIKHDWVGNTVSDHLHHHNESFHSVDKALYQARKAQGFPLAK